MDPAPSLSHAANAAAPPTVDKRSALYDLTAFFLEGGIQIWVPITGKRMREADAPWLRCPLGERGRIGTGIYERIARDENLQIRVPPGAGLIPDFNALRGPNFNPDAIHPAIRDFYEHAAAYHLEVWTEVSLLGRFFLWLLVEFISRRMEQLNFPISSLEVELFHAAADKFHEKPEKKAAEQRDFGPYLEVIGSGVFVEITNGRMNRVRVEIGTAERVEIGNEAGAGGNADLKIFVARDALVDSRADAAAFAERAAQPGGIGFAHALAGNADPDLNATFEEEGNQIVKRRSFVNRWRGRGVRGMGEGRSRVHGSIVSLMGIGGCLAAELCSLK